LNSVFVNFPLLLSLSFFISSKFYQLPFCVCGFPIS
jgi:hypothetical protein